MLLGWCLAGGGLRSESYECYGYAFEGSDVSDIMPARWSGTCLQVQWNYVELDGNTQEL